MGRTTGSYSAEFPVGTLVRIINRPDLEDFAKSWRWHHPLESSQLDFADHVAEVNSVSFYHGGDELYELTGIPGIWHEQCLNRVDEGAVILPK